MTGIEIFTLLVVGVFVIGGAAYQFYKYRNLPEDTAEKVKDIEVKAQEVANELYNKDLRPIVAKKAPKKEAQVEEVKKETKSEFPIEKPKRKRKYYPRKK